MLPHDRLKAARVAAGYETAAAAAAALGVGATTYVNHENGTRGLTREAPRYARFSRVSLDWLLTGRGPMRGGAAAASEIAITGIATAGDVAVPSAEEEAHAALGFAALPDPDRVFARRVEGDSMWPRFQHGEIVVFDAVPRRAVDLIGRYALVQLADGRCLIKKLGRAARPGRVMLQSHNADPVEAEPLAAWAYVLTLA